ncbi:uncharacterized protein LOC126902057 [Daktulosphaira vitifoliae]|uniref:uncharacterized protein LOC126902057 n=1 Tax=Daktulosphaira vitifoliae TaxID=58002 RepID=UPI0021AA785E|nr:uncharacterized protein LOC126902057 [Daktulosphaira vitifoliae]
MKKIIHTVRSSSTRKFFWIISKSIIIKLLRLLRSILNVIHIATSFALDNTERLIKYLDRNFDSNISCTEYYMDTENQILSGFNGYQNTSDQGEQQNILVLTNDVDTSDANDLPLTESNCQNTPFVSTENVEQQNALASTNEVFDSFSTNNLLLTESNGQSTSLVPTQNDNGTMIQHQLSQVGEDERRLMMKDMPKFHLTENYDYPLRVLYTVKDYLFLAKVNEEKVIRSLERRINAFYSYCKEKTYTPQLDELCVIKYNDGKWYRGVCKAINDDGDKTTFFISLLDWGEFIMVNASNIRKIRPFFIQHTPLAVKCVLRDLKLSRIPKKILWKLSNKVFNCNIVTRVGPTYYEIKSKQITSLLKNKNKL